MGGFFGTISKSACSTDFYSMAPTITLIWGPAAAVWLHTIRMPGLTRSIHNLESSYFRTKFEPALDKFVGNAGIGIISDTDAQPIVINSHLGKFAIVTVAKINNIEEFETGFAESEYALLRAEFGQVLNQTETGSVADLTQGKNFVEGIENVYGPDQRLPVPCLLLTEDGIIVARDKWGRTPIIIRKKHAAYAATSESSSLPNLDYEIDRFVGPGPCWSCPARQMGLFRNPS